MLGVIELSRRPGTAVSASRAQPVILCVFGTRPEAIKMAPVVNQLSNCGLFNCQVAVTAQHREMLDQVLDLFNISPAYDLNIMQAGQTLFDITMRALHGLGEIYKTVKPDLVLVHGDTSTTFVGALAAFYQQIPVGHVEAGLRTKLKYAPFPEEMNRHLTGVLADLHFAPTPAAADNLQKEGVEPDRIFITGNTVIDALLATVKPDFRFDDPALASLDFDRKIILLTTHRRENWGEPMRHIFQALRNVIVRHPEVDLVFPVHRNPDIRRLVSQELDDCPRVTLCEPLDYASFVNLMAQVHLVFTDSGGLQEEAPSLGKPVLVLRETTERPEALEAGTAALVGTDRENIVRELERLLVDPDAYQRMANAVNPYGDGQAGIRIRQAVEYFFGLRQNPPHSFPEVLREHQGRNDICS